MKAILQFAGIAVVLAIAAPTLLATSNGSWPGSGPVTGGAAEPVAYAPEPERQESRGATAAFRADSDFSGHYEARRVATRPAPPPAPVQSAARPAPAPAASAAAPAQVATATEKRPARTSSSRTRIPADARGHYLTEAKLNGRRVEVLVDTGATKVAINRSTARRVGLRIRDNDFKYTVNTANGQARMAKGKLKSVRIGTVMVRDVEVAVLEDESLDGALLGMSFLNKLRRFSVERGALVLER